VREDDEDGENGRKLSSYRYLYVYKTPAHTRSEGGPIHQLEYAVFGVSLGKWMGGQQAGGHDVDVVEDGVQVTGLLDLRIIRVRVRGWIRRVDACVREQCDTEKKGGLNGGK
jgi:hypothetical protein